MAAGKPDMLIDAVDDGNVVIGTVERSRVFQRKQNFRTVHIILCVNSQIVLQQLPTQHVRSPGKLGSSVAGYLVAGENYYQAAKRKLKDELYLDVSIVDCGTLIMIDQGCKKFVKVYRSKINDMHISYNTNEITRLRFWSTDFINEALKRVPSVFTPTFVEVYGRAIAP